MSGALEGIRVIDSTTMVAMPTALHIMADMGAEVIKVDSHTLFRSDGGVFPENDPGERHWDRDGSFNTLQRGKVGVTLNLKEDNAVDAFKDIVRVSDVIIENNRSGTMDRLGLGYDALRAVKPDLIYLSNTGFGYTGPWRSYAGIGRMFELTCGLSQFAGYEDEGPRRVGISFFDQHVGWMAVFAVLAALHHRDTTGEGQWVDFAMYQIGVSTLGDAVMDYISNGRSGTSMGNRHKYLSPHGVYQCKGEDRWVAITTENDEQWETLVDQMGSPTWAQEEKFADPILRWHNQDELDQLIGDWTKDKDQADLANELQKVGVPAIAVMDGRDFALDPHIKEREFFERVTHQPETDIGTRLYFGRPWKMSKTPAYIRRPAPMLGEHNEYVFGDLLGIDQGEIAKMYETNAIGKDPINPGSAKPTNLAKQIEQGVGSGIDPDYRQKLGI